MVPHGEVVATKIWLIPLFIATKTTDGVGSQALTKMPRQVISMIGIQNLVNVIKIVFLVRLTDLYHEIILLYILYKYYPPFQTLCTDYPLKRVHVTLNQEDPSNFTNVANVQILTFPHVNGIAIKIKIAWDMLDQQNGELANSQPHLNVHLAAQNTTKDTPDIC